MSSPQVRRRANPLSWIAAAWSRSYKGLAGMGRRWKTWSRRRRILSGALVLLAAVMVTLATLTATGIAAAIEARSAASRLEGELQGFTPLDMIQVTASDSLEQSFLDFKRSTAKARSRLSFLKAFQWAPFVGGRIEEAHLLMDLGFSLARAGADLAAVYQSALGPSLDSLDADESQAQVAESLQRSNAQLRRVQSDLTRASVLHGKLKQKNESGGVMRVVDRYLPVVQAATFVSITSPRAIGQSYVVGRNLDNLQVWVDDPLGVIANPVEASATLSEISKGAADLGLSLAVVRRSAEQGELEQGQNSQALLDILRLMEQGAIVLHHTSAGGGAVVEVAEAIEVEGFLTKSFGVRAGTALENALQELEVARQEIRSFRDLLSVRGLDAGQVLPASLLEGFTDLSPDGSSQLETLLEELTDATRFFRSFFGFREPRTYLLLGQNQNEIRATGGFIGVAIEAHLDQGELVALKYKDSTTVDRRPLTGNPPPPDPIYWYLWMGRLLFRDSNWDPNFPTSAVKIAEMYEAGQGVKVDGVIAGTKDMALDMAELYGDITVPEVDGILTRSRAEAYAEDQLPYPCRPRHISLKGKRCFDEDLFFSLKDRVTSSMPGEVKRKIVELLRSQLDRKNALIHLLDPEDSAFLWERKWNGAMPAVDHDYLMLVDSSLPGHSAAQLERTIEHRVALRPGARSSVQMRLRYRHGQDQPDPTCRQAKPAVLGCYWNYFRLFLSPLAEQVTFPPVPLHQGSEKLIWGYPDADSARIRRQIKVGGGPRVELAGYIAVEPGTTTTIPIAYDLAEGALHATAQNTYEYRLLIQKQPGIDRDHIIVVLDLPPGSELLSTSVPPTGNQGQAVAFDFTLLKDTLLTVSFRTN